jgi:hypothetical protein
METNTSFLELYAGLVMAFIAFATIVATLRQTAGGGVTPPQNLLVHFYMESGFLHLVVAIAALALLTVLPHDLVWRIINYATLASIVCYMPYYLTRRRKINAPVPLVTVLVILGYVAMAILTIVVATELIWVPSLATVTIFMVWALIADIIVFVYYLSTFVERTEAESETAP